MSIEYLRVAAGQWRTAALAKFCLFLSMMVVFSVSSVIPAAHANSPAASITQIINSLKAKSGSKTSPQRTSFVIGLTKRSKFQVFSLTNPNRVILDLDTARLALPPHPGSRPVGLVKSFRVGRSAPGKSRIVINVTTPVIVEKANIRKSDGRTGSHHLVLDIVPVASATKPTKKARPGWMTAAANMMSKLGASAVQPPLPKRALTRAQLRANTYRPLIVIDPGHGGHDTGAVKNGAVEKRVVLAFAKALRKKLLATGRYRVSMTRTKDVFVPLGDRVRFAEQRDAALFIAVHADYARSSARGATVYTLRNSTAKRLRRRSGRSDAINFISAKKEAVIRRQAGASAGVIKTILADLMVREQLVNQHRTSAFSETVVRYLGKSTNLKDEPHRSAGFRVLKTSKVPSVLIELAYVTNRRDAALLKSRKWRNKVAGSITTAVDNYFESQIAQLPM